MDFCNIVKCTKCTSRQIKEQMKKEIYGDSTCSLSNMKNTCFACEYCNTSNTVPENSIHDDNTYILEDTNRYIASVNLTDAAQNPFIRVMHPECETTAGYVASLCVAFDQRGRGHAKALLNYCQWRYPVLYLAVALPTSKDTTTAELMRTRSQKLLHMYYHLNFRYVCETMSQILLRREAVENQ